MSGARSSSTEGLGATVSPMSIELQLSGVDPAVLHQAADALERLRLRLSPELLAKIVGTFERLVEEIKSEGGALKVVTRDSGLSAAGAVHQVVDVHFPERFLEFLAAVCALDGEIERIYQSYSLLGDPSRGDHLAQKASV